MTALPLVVALTAVMALSALLLSGLALFQARALLQSSERRNQELIAQHEARLDSLTATLEALATEVHELESQPAAGLGNVKAGLNLSKRSQALRMHRRGEPVTQIASALDVPPQEVELLIKVQRIILSKL